MFNDIVSDNVPLDVQRCIYLNPNLNPHPNERENERDREKTQKPAREKIAIVRKKVDFIHTIHVHSSAGCLVVHIV